MSEHKATATSSDRPRTAAELGIMQGSPPARLIDMSRWDKGDDARWAFQHISELIPTANISRGPGAASVLESRPQDITGVSFATPAGEVVTVGETLEATYTDGFLVLHEGTIVAEEYFNGMTPETRHLLMSVSKSVTGILAGVLVADGRLDPDERVTSYIPEMGSSSGFADATVRQVLDMTTAIAFREDYDDPEAEVARHEVATAWRGRSELANEGLFAFAQTIERVDRAHGELFHYASINTDVLGWLIERVSGQRFVEVMSDTIWSRLGAEHDAQLSVDYKGSPVANGGFCVTLRDLARFSQMVLDGGWANGHQMIPSDWIDDIRSNGQNSAWRPTAYGDVWPHGSYRNQWYITGDDHGSFFAAGVNGQHIWINPTTQALAVKFSSFPVSADVPSAMQSMRAMDAITRTLK